MFGYVYILKSLKNGNFYIGSTTDLQRRITEHMNGKGSKTTKRLLPLKLVFAQQFDQNVYRDIELKLKKLKNKNLLELIIQKGKVFLNNQGKLNW